ncbi:hypothetical protein GCM10011608_30270 [Micromonospora sonchi]|uniref:Uncharacterized protein n=1 Tax=Micromonospora sonchi TaxID=1763543 RepID=A0A917WZA4_9ACTN|nr:hypothetical protein [Micromonospora sonchi]GGM43505.1 hypothetical protein GCM10011608_30270 [Micromonospora sonchi]
MTEAAKKVAEDAEHRLDSLAEDVRRRFDRILKGRFSDQVKAGRFSDQAGRLGDRDPSESDHGGRGGRGGHGVGQARTDQHRRERGGSR